MRLGDEHIDTHIELFQLGLDSLFPRSQCGN
ncbi:hypothetical protein WBU86_20135 [Escherichia coli]